MEPTRYQRTITNPTSVEGFGYWSGQDVRVEFCPAPPDSGLVFVRDDLPGKPRIPAVVEHRLDIPRRTSLGLHDARVDMIEHLMAALAGLRVDNCEIHVDQPEMPGCEGSSLPFVEALDAAGIVEQSVPRTRHFIGTSLYLGDEQSWVQVEPSEDGRTELRYRLDYGPVGPIGRQRGHVVLTPDSFRSELAPSRTFMLRTEADQMLAAGLGQRVTSKDLLVFDQDGPIDNPLRFPDECVRHKLLDMVGDLALAGCDLVGRFTAYRSGHQKNAQLVRSLTSRTELKPLNRKEAHRPKRIA